MLKKGLLANYLCIFRYYYQNSGLISACEMYREPLEHKVKIVARQFFKNFAETIKIRITCLDFQNKGIFQ